jgi:hypothetical protein
MPEKRVVFVAFAIEDERRRDFRKGQSPHPHPFEFTDMSAKGRYDTKNCPASSRPKSQVQYLYKCGMRANISSFVDSL